MSFQSIDYRERFIASRAKILGDFGINLLIGSDFSEYRHLLSKARSDHEIGAPFDPELHSLDASNAVWIMGETTDGRLVHTQALRLLEIGSGTLSDYLLSRFVDFPPSGVELDWGKCKYRPGPGAMRMGGQIAYHGEFWIDGSNEAYRGTGLSSVFSRCGYWEAMQRWDPDHIFAFMAKPVAFKGLAERAGWMHTEPGALRWVMKGHDTALEGFLAYLHRYDLEYLLDVPLNDQMAMAA